MGASSFIRCQSRFQVRWPLVYGTDDFVGQGTLLDLSTMGGRMAGNMPVERNQLVTLHVLPTCDDCDLRMYARVTWVCDGECGFELVNLSTQDHHWLLRYTDRAERRSMFDTRQPGTAPNLSSMPVALPIQD